MGTPFARRFGVVRTILKMSVLHLIWLLCALFDSHYLIISIAPYLLFTHTTSILSLFFPSPIIMSSHYIKLLYKYQFSWCSSYTHFVLGLSEGEGTQGAGTFPFRRSAKLTWHRGERGRQVEGEWERGRKRVWEREIEIERERERKKENERKRVRMKDRQTNRQIERKNEKGQ